MSRAAKIRNAPRRSGYPANHSLNRNDGTRQGVAALALIAAAVSAIPSLFDLSRPLCAIGLLLVVFSPFAVLRSGRGIRYISDPAFAIGVMWLLACAIPILLHSLYHDRLWNAVSRTSLDIAALWMYRGFSAFSLVYWASKAWISRKHVVFHVSDQYRMSLFRLAVGFIGLIGAVSEIAASGGKNYSFIESSRDTSTFLQILFELHRLAPVYVWLYAYSVARQESSNAERWLFFAILIGQGFYFLASGTKFVPLELLIAWGMGSLAGRSRMNFRRDIGIALLSVVGVYAAFTVVTTYREEMKARQIRVSSSFVETLDFQMGALGASVAALVPDTRSEKRVNRSGAVLDRLGYLTAFGMVLDVTRLNSPRENALASTVTPIFAVVPRAAFGGKAQFMNSGRMAQILGWSFGGFSVTLPGSFYWAWGLPGIIFGMAAFGLILSNLSIRADGLGMDSLIARTVLARFAIETMDVGREFQAILIGTTRTLILAILIFYLVKFLVPRARS